MTVRGVMAAVMVMGGVALGASKEEYAKIAGEVEGALQRDVVRAWFPRCVDPNGGFHANWDRQWKKLPGSGRFIVFQSRQTWISAQIAMHRPELREEFLGYARHGVKYLDEVMWDKEFGGFYWQLDNEGKLGRETEKHLYGEAFGMYAAAAAYQATKDERALDLAKRAFAWLEEHAHDREHGGYHEIYSREGKVLGANGPVTPRANLFAGGAFIYGYKSMNAHIHMLEALAELYKAWKDPLVKERLRETLVIVRDRIAVEPGCLNQYLTADWRATPEHDSIGHDVETGFLLLEAEECLGEQDVKTARMARMLVDHALIWGWDEERGGFYDKGYAFGKAFDLKKVWWAEVEGLHALLVMHEKFGKEDERYWKAFVKQWGFVKKYMIDGEWPGLFEEVEADGKVARMGKGSNWKAGYHDGRSFLMVVEKLREVGKGE
jgi:mannobiose 2-epimerase